MKCVQAGAMGAAILGSVACGWFADTKRATETFVKVDRIFSVDQKGHEKYLKYYEIYERIYERVRDIVHDLSRMDEDGEPGG